MNERIQRIREQQALSILDGLDQHLAGQVEITLVRDKHGVVVVRETVAGGFRQQARGVSIADACAQFLQAQAAPATMRSRDTIPCIDNPSDALTQPGCSVSPV